MIIIGIHGKMGSGKDTIGAHLCENYDFHRVAFGEEVRKELSQSTTLLNGIHTPSFVRELLEIPQPERDIEIWTKPTTDRVRQSLQWLGMFMRKTQPNYWLVRASKAIHYSGHKRIVITDLRFHNELYYVDNMGGEVWNVTRATRPKSEHDGHISETELDGYKFHHKIKNNGTLDGLYKTVDVMITRSLSRDLFDRRYL